MTDYAEDPVGQASTKVAQCVSLAMMAAEAIAQRHQQHAAAAASTDARAAAALRAQETGAHTAARLQWQPVLDPRRARSLSLADTGLAWAAAQAWRPIDPEAELASARAQDRLRELRPDVMSRFDRLTGDGLDPVEAMRRVAPFLDRPAARAQPTNLRTALPVADPMPPAAPGSVADRQDGDGPASAAALPPAVAPASGDPQATVTLAASVRTPPEVARDGYPEPLTGQVLAGGKVKAKTPDRTAPAAMRSTSLATAARAVSRRAR